MASSERPQKKTPVDFFGHQIKIIGTYIRFRRPILERTAASFSEKKHTLGPPTRLLSNCLLCFKTGRCREAEVSFWACSLFEKFQSGRTVQISNVPLFQSKVPSGHRLTPKAQNAATTVSETEEKVHCLPVASPAEAFVPACARVLKPSSMAFEPSVVPEFSSEELAALQWALEEKEKEPTKVGCCCCSLPLLFVAFV